MATGINTKTPVETGLLFINVDKNMANLENNFKVRLIPITALTRGQDPSAIRASQVAFDVTPTFSETRSAEYSPVTPVHMPGSIQMYKHTNSRTFEIGATLISRNVDDAMENMRKLQVLRSWLLPYFGSSSTLTDSNRNFRSARNTSGDQSLSAEDKALQQQRRIEQEGVQLLGAPPDVLYLYAYSTGKNDERQGFGGNFTRVNINRVPVVMTNLSITYPDDVDYIPVYEMANGGPTVYTEPFPRKMQVNVSVVETHSPREYENFNLANFKSGTLVNF